MRNLLLMLSLIGLLTSCGTTAPRVVLVPWAVWADGKPETAVRLAEDVVSDVYVRIDGEWVRANAPVTLPAGWYAVAPPPPTKGGSDED